MLKVAKNMDLDGNGTIDRDEVVSAIVSHSPHTYAHREHSGHIGESQQCEHSHTKPIGVCVPFPQRSRLAEYLASVEEAKMDTIDLSCM